MKRIERAWSEILESLGYDITDPHLRDTPARVARFFAEWHTQNVEPPNLTVFDSDRYDEIILVRDIPYYSMCAHHGAPFFGKGAIAYIPDEKIIGLSKFARVLDHFARRFTVQERITQEVATYLESKLCPRGLAVVLDGEHMCMSMRGVKKPGHCTTTSAMLGAFRSNPIARAELMGLLRRR